MRFCTTLCISSVRRLGITLVGCTRRVDVEVQADVAGVVGGPGVDEVAAEDDDVSCVERERDLLAALVKRVDDQLGVVLKGNDHREVSVRG